MPLSASSELCVGMYAELRTNELLAVRHSTGQVAQMLSYRVVQQRACGRWQVLLQPGVWRRWALAALAALAAVRAG